MYLLRAQRDVDADDVRAILYEIAGPLGQEDVMTAGEQLIQQGRVDALRSGIAAVLSARGLECSEDTRSKLAGCSDASSLARWLARAATAPSETEVFAEVEGES